MRDHNELRKPARFLIKKLLVADRDGPQA